MYRVIQITETGEEFVAAERHSEDAAWQWVERNADNYPESRFYVESARSYHNACLDEHDELSYDEY